MTAPVGKIRLLPFPLVRLMHKMPQDGLLSASSRLYYKCYDAVIDSSARAANNATIYEQLQHTEDQFRLLHIYPGPRRSPIVATLTTQSISSAVQYKALSYVWGPARLSASITIGGKAVYITRNLKRCLEHLRHESRQLILWADALCINQIDLNERNHQVRLMERIYRSADTVVVWMDIKVDTTQPAFEKMLSLSEESTLSMLGHDPDFWLPLRELFTDPYWNRIWVQQELILARKSIFQCQDVELDGNKLGFLLHLIGERGRAEERNGLGMLWHDLLTTFDIHAMTKIFPPQARFLWRSETFRRENTTEPVILIHLIASMARLLTTDPRDRVYAFLALAPDRDLLTAAGFKVDYSRQVGEVFSDVAVAHGNVSGNLDFLEFATQYHRSRDLPSWVPDWGTTTFPMISSFGETRADAHVAHPKKLSPTEDGTISAFGFPVTQVAHVFELEEVPLNIGHLVNSLLQFCAHALSLIQGAEAADKRADDLFRDQVRQILSSGGPRLLPKYYPMESSLLQSLKDIATGSSPFASVGPDFNRGQGHPDMDDMLKQVIFQIKTAILFKSLAFAEEGRALSFYQGCGKAGDEVWVILGCQVPMVLRRRNRTQKVIGPCYALGLMDGAPLAGIADENATAVAEEGIPTEKWSVVYNAAEEVSLR